MSITLFFFFFFNQKGFTPGRIFFFLLLICKQGNKASFWLWVLPQATWMPCLLFLWLHLSLGWMEAQGQSPPRDSWGKQAFLKVPPWTEETEMEKESENIGAKREKLLLSFLIQSEQKRWLSPHINFLISAAPFPGKPCFWPSLYSCSISASYPRDAHRATSPGLCNECMLSHFSRVRLFVTLWTVARQAPLSMGFSRQEYWSGLPCPPPGRLLSPGIEPKSLMSPALAGGFCTPSAT